MTAPTKPVGVISSAQAAEMVGVGAPAVRHEVFCQPTGERTEVRIERFLALSDDLNGRSRPTHDVTRCLECGAATYLERN